MFKVGDKVKVKSLDWYNKNKNVDRIQTKSGVFFTYQMSKFCGKEVTIKGIYSFAGFTLISIKEFGLNWTEDMFELSYNKLDKLDIE